MSLLRKGNMSWFEFSFISSEFELLIRDYHLKVLSPFLFLPNILAKFLNL